MIVFHPKNQFTENYTRMQHTTQCKKEMNTSSPHFKESFPATLCSKERAKGEKEGSKERKFWSTLLALGTSSCNAFILSAILSLRSCNKRMARVSNKTQQDAEEQDRNDWFCSCNRKLYISDFSSVSEFSAVKPRFYMARICSFNWSKRQ
jgi:hypothetical protein